MFIDRRRPQHSQKYFHNRQLVRKIIRKTSFGKNDIVIEIGPGKGIITQELLKTVGSVIAVEIDEKLCDHLRLQLGNNPNLKLICRDFLSFPLPDSSYKVFSNTPFSIEGEIIRKLLDGKNPPLETHLVVIKDVGERWAGHRQESLFSVTHKPWFEMAVAHRFKRADFKPEPKVDSIMISIFKRKKPLLNDSEKKRYINFIKAGFGGGRRINSNLLRFFSASQLKNLSKKYNFSYKARPSDIKFEQWLILYNSCSLRNGRHKRLNVRKFR